MKQLSTTDYGLIGHPLGHSRSKALFAGFFAADGSNRSYDNFDMPELTPASLYALVLLNPALKGFNVTSPYKERIIEFLDRIDPAAKAVGAVNTVKVCRADDGRVTALEGYNTDVEGFAQSVAEFVDRLPAGSGALVAGSGGAAKAVCQALKQSGIEAVMVSRNPAEGMLGYDDLTPEVMQRNLLVINATPLGTAPDVDSCPPIPYDLLTSSHYAHDLVYNPEETEFMRRCRAAGATVKNGAQMLRAQAEAALRIWQNNN